MNNTHTTATAALDTKDIPVVEADYSYIPASAYRSFRENIAIELAAAIVTRTSYGRIVRDMREVHNVPNVLCNGSAVIGVTAREGEAAADLFSRVVTSHDNICQTVRDLETLQAWEDAHPPIGHMV